MTLRTSRTSARIYFFLPTLIKNGQVFEGRPTEIIVRLKSERSISFPLSRTLSSLYDYRVDSSSGENPALYTPRGNRPVTLRLA